MQTTENLSCLSTSCEPCFTLNWTTRDSTNTLPHQDIILWCVRGEIRNSDIQTFILQLNNRNTGKLTSSNTAQEVFKHSNIKRLVTVLVVDLKWRNPTETFFNEFLPGSQLLLWAVKTKNTSHTIITCISYTLSEGTQSATLQPEVVFNHAASHPLHSKTKSSAVIPLQLDLVPCKNKRQKKSEKKLE